MLVPLGRIINLDVQYCYLVHWIAIQMSNWLAGHTIWWLIPTAAADVMVAAVVILLSVLSYRLVERPARTSGRRLALSSSAAPQS
jgi:peptidoglycan/LPS O-acetylase OafA/YrhL